MCHESPGPRQSPGPGCARSQGPQKPRAGAFSEASGPASGELVSAPRRGQSQPKVALGARDGPGAGGFVGFSPRVRPSAARPPRTDSNLPPGPGCTPPQAGPGPHLRECNFLLGPGSAPRLRSAQLDDLAVREAAPAPARGSGRFPGGSRREQPSSREGGPPRKLCRAVTARWPGRPATRSRPAARRRADAGRPPPLSTPLSRHGLPPDRSRGFARGLRGCCLPGRWVALPVRAGAVAARACRLSLTSQQVFC